MESQIEELSQVLSPDLCYFTFVPPAYQPAVACRKFLHVRSPVQYAYNQSAAQTARLYPPRGCTRLPGYPPAPAYASTL
eukprot:1812493-Rhodomonas_salina.1